MRNRRIPGENMRNRLNYLEYLENESFIDTFSVTVNWIDDEERNTETFD